MYMIVYDEQIFIQKIIYSFPTCFFRIPIIPYISQISMFYLNLELNINVFDYKSVKWLATKACVVCSSISALNISACYDDLISPNTYMILSSSL